MKTKQLSKGWKEVELREVGSVLTGFAFKSDKFNSQGVGKPLIRIRNLQTGETDTYYSGEYSEDYLVKKGDFLIGMDGEFKIYEWKSEDSLLNQRLCKLILDQEKVAPKYIFYLLNKNLKKIEDKTPFVTVKHISSKQIESIKIPLPPLSTQKKIVSILEKAEELKKKREEADKLTQEYLKSVFYEMFLKKKNRFENIELGKVAPLQGGFAFKSQDYIDEGIKLVKINNVWKDVITWEDKTNLPLDYLEKYSDFSLNEKDLVFSMTRPIIKSLDSVKIAQIKNNDLPCLLNQRVGRFKVKRGKISEKYLLYYCYSDFFKKEIEKLASTSLQPNVSSNQINRIKIPLPPISLQEKFASIVEKVEKMKEKQNKNREYIEELFNVLMQKAFKGELVR